MSNQLNIATSYRIILQAARERRFVSYGDLAKASGVEWSGAIFREMPQHLGELVSACVNQGRPMISAIVTNNDGVSTGKLEGAPLDGFISLAKKLELFATTDKALSRFAVGLA